MIDAYVTALPGSTLGAIGSSLLVVGLSLVVGTAVTVVALVAGALVERGCSSGGRGDGRRFVSSRSSSVRRRRKKRPEKRPGLTFSLDSARRTL